jgi:hypothetical protein
MINARMVAVQGIGYAPFAAAVQGVVDTVPVPLFYREEGVGPDEINRYVHDWRYGIRPDLRKTGDQEADLKAHLLEMTKEPLQGDTELERQEAKLARTFGLAAKDGLVDVPLFKPVIKDLPKNLAADIAAYKARVAEEVREERRRIILLLSE